jgi:hypothetical protein
MKEYGSNIQKLVDYIVALPDIEKRTKHAHILVELMRQIHPQMRDGMDYSKKLWDDLYIMADFNLTVDSPFPPPPKEILGRKPMQIPYNQHQLKHKYYGRNVELLILKAMLAETFDERKAFVSYLVKLLKSFFLNWNKDTVETHTVLQQILELSGYKLQAEVDALRKDGLIEDANPRDGNGGGRPARQPYQSFSQRPERRERNDRNDRNGNVGGNGYGYNSNGNNRNNPNNKNRFNKDNNKRRRP